VLIDAWAVWNVKSQRYEIESIMDKGHACNVCDGECRIKEIEIADETEPVEEENNYFSEAIRRLEDLEEVLFVAGGFEDVLDNDGGLRDFLKKVREANGRISAN